MDKDQATRFVLDRAQAGFGISEISVDLSRELGAPLEMTQRFVEQVVRGGAGSVEGGGAMSVEGGRTSHAAPEHGSTGTPEHRNTGTPEHRNTAPPKYSGLPLGLQRIVAEYEAAGAPRPRDAEPAPKPRIPSGADLPRQAPFAPPSRARNRPEGAELSAAARQNLTEEILQQFKKRRRVNDVIEYVCVETGWHWNKSQRFVARVRTEHHDELHAEEKRWKVLTGAGIMLGGLIIALFGGKWLFDYAKLAAFAKTNPGDLLGVSATSAFFAFTLTIFGVGMILGGIYAIGRGLTER
jgi:hypothetical protein